MKQKRYDIYCGIDVGKSTHHAVALAADGRRILGRNLPQDEAQLRELFTELTAQGSVLMVVDQPRNIGALSIAVARDTDIDVAYLPGLRMRRIAALYPGQAKTDAKDAFIIADAARTLPDTLLPVTQDDDIVEGLRMLAGFDADLAVEENRISGRIRSVLLSVHPALERAIGKHLYRPVALTLLAEFGGPVGFAAATAEDLRRVAKRSAPRNGGTVAAQILAALGEQTVIVPGAEKSNFVLKTLARQLSEVRRARAELEEQFEVELSKHPAGPVLTSMPGVGVRIAATVLVEIGDVDRFESAGNLAAYAGVAPRTHRSGTSIRGEHRQRGGNARLKRALYLSAFASLREPASRIYYDRKRAEGKDHRSALICLARRRTNVLYVMLKTGSKYLEGAATTHGGNTIAA